VSARRLSLRTRLLAGMAVVAVVLVVVSIAITVTTRNQLMAQVDDRLATFAVPGRFEDQPRPPSLPNDGDDDGDDRPERVSDVYQGFIDESGVLTTIFTPNVDGIAIPPAIDADDLPTSGRSLFTTDSDDGAVTYRVLAEVSDAFGGVVFITALPIDDVQSTIASLIVVEAIGSLIILMTLGMVSWWVVRLGIRPLKRMTHTATLIADGDLEVRVPEDGGGAETAELAEALNRMLAHLGSALDERAESEARLRRFVADASHELRTPVTTIRGYAELYRHGGLGEADALDDAMRRTEQEAVRMGRLVEDMLTLAKLDEQRPLERRPVDIGRLVIDAVADAKAATPTRDITAAVDGAVDGAAIVRGDEDRLRQVLANVVGNAIVHTDPDVPIVVRVNTDDESVVVEVQDHGAGMPAEVAERVTERFYRADPARSRHRGGSGLGLSIVDAAMSAHGGTVTIDSEPDRGTTVRLELPAAESPA
jgi:two-component system, OmpR family, sensor kinase